MHDTENLANAAQAQPDRFLDEGETEEILKLKRSTLQKLRMRRQGPPFIRLGRKVVYSYLDLQEYMRKRRRVQTEEAA
jgi:predicted DNA-binding transcriptional regulator AlpA